MILVLVVIYPKAVHLLLVVLVISLVPTHYKLLFSLFKADRAHRLVAVMGYVDVGHVLLVLTVEAGNLA